MGRREVVQIARELERTPLPALPQGYGNSDAAERNQSLARCFDYSYRLLDDDLKQAFAHLSLFADTFDAESAALACGLSNAQEALDRLYEKSLLTRAADAGGNSRYAMLRPTRAYAADHLNALPDAIDQRNRYVTHYRKLVQDNDDVKNLRKLALLDREWRNVVAAADFAKANQDAASLIALSEYLGDFLLLRARWAEHQQLNERALKAARDAKNREAEGRALNNLGVVYDSQGRWQEAITSYEQDLANCREYGDRMGEGQTLNNLGVVYQSQGRWQEAITSYEQSLVICREYGDRMGEGQTLENIALLYSAQGDTEKALEWERQALAVLQTTQDARAVEKARGLIAQWEALLKRPGE